MTIQHSDHGQPFRPHHEDINHSTQHVHPSHTRVYGMQTQDRGEGTLRCIKTKRMRRPQSTNRDTSFKML